MANNEFGLDGPQMRARHLIDRYRDFAARTHLVMGLFAFGLVVAIIVLMIVSAVPSQAGFLAAEAKNLISMAPSGDLVLVSVVVLVFLAVFAVNILTRNKIAK